MRNRIKRTTSGMVAAVLLLGALLLTASPAAAADTLSPANPKISYDAGPFTNANVGGLLLGSCEVPDGCDTHEITVDVPKSYYAGIRNQGRIGAVRFALSWEDTANDFDLSILDKDGNTVATSGFGNSDFERIEFAELPSGTYTVQVAIFKVVNTSFHMEISLQTLSPSKSAGLPGTGGLTLGARTAAATTDADIAFSNGTPVALERSSGEPNMEIAPNGDIYIDMPLGAPTNGILYKSTDGGDTWRPLAPTHPNNNPMPLNPAGGGDTWTTISNDGRICYSELNTLTSLGVACSTDDGATFGLSTLVIDPQTPLVDRQWMATTPQGETFIDAQFGIVSVGPSQPGIVLFKELPGTAVFTPTVHIDTGRAMKTYNIAVDPTDTDDNGGTIVQAYLRSNQDADKAQNPHQLMVWQSTDGGASATTHVVANLPTTPGNNFASIDVDRQGNVYVAWSEQGTWDILYSVARKGDLDHWSEPVRVNPDTPTRTAIQPTIKAGDRGRVFIGYYAAEQLGNPDALPGGLWHAYLSWSLNGACGIDASPCDAPTFRQTRITEHPVQFRGICLGGTGCGGDPYYGDRSMLEFLDLAFEPKTGAIHVITTDSSRANLGTTITSYKQIAGPSPFANAAPIEGTTRFGSSVADGPDDAGWPNDSPVPMQSTPGADITSVALSRPSADVLRITMKVADATAFVDALDAALGNELLIATRFATDQDVLWAGMRTAGGEPAFVAGHLASNLFIDSYIPDVEDLNGSVDESTGTITIDVPLAKLMTTLPQPATVETPAKEVRAVGATTPLYAVTGFSFVALNSIDDELPKHLTDVTPAFTYAPASALAVKGRDTTTTPKTDPRPALPATGVGFARTGWALIAAAMIVAIWGRRRRPA